MDLRDEILKLAHEVPEMRKHLVPLLKQADTDFWVAKSKLPPSLLFAANVVSPGRYPGPAVFESALKRLKTEMTKAGGKFGPIHFVQLMPKRIQLACLSTNADMEPPNGVPVLSGGMIKTFDAAIRKPTGKSFKKASDWSLEVLIAAKSAKAEDYQKAINETEAIAGKIQSILGDRVSSSYYRVDPTLGGCWWGVQYQLIEFIHEKGLSEASEITDKLEKLDFDTSTLRKGIQGRYELIKKRRDAELARLNWLHEHGIDRVEMSGGCNLGRCYNRYDYTVYPLPGVDLDEIKIREVADDLIAVGQSGVVIKKNPNGTIDLSTKVDSSD